MHCCFYGGLLVHVPIHWGLIDKVQEGLLIDTNIWEERVAKEEPLSALITGL